LTTNHVCGETWTYLRRSEGFRAGISFLDMVAGSPRIRTVRVPRAVEEDAVRWLRRHDEREYSFVDATSFAFMRAEGIEAALAFDGDFSAAGFVELRA